MKRMTTKIVGTAILFIIISAIPIFSQQYILIGWNDLGMHCSNKDFSKIAVLPPYNNVHAQLILKAPNQLPEVITTGFTISYSIPGNTYSVGKTNFWTYAQQLFNLPSPLTANIGLTGNGLSGSMIIDGNSFVASAIPVTPYTDNNLTTENPYQLIHLEARSDISNELLAYTDVVIPVSNEISCVSSGCHTSEQAILNSHESVSGFNKNGPNLCANCHASNALGTTGKGEAGIFSYRIHNEHKNLLPENDINTCYKCHPGQNTKCFRGAMSSTMKCQDCHGTMSNVASTISSGRRPWLDEPKCGNASCHGSNYSEEANKLFRQSKGHGGLYCSVCHGSPHALLPSTQPNDNLQNIRLQGFAGTLSTCSVCHSTIPDGPGPHGISPLPVELVSFKAVTKDNSVNLNWITATEINNTGFEISRKNNNGEFKVIGFIKGHGQSSIKNNYTFPDNNLIADKYIYRLTQIDFNGTKKVLGDIEVNISSPDNYSLSQNYPNPFNPSTTIYFRIPSDSKVTIRVFDATGKEVAVLLNELKAAGEYNVQFNGNNLPSGIYFYELMAGKFRGVMKMMLLK